MKTLKERIWYERNSMNESLLELLIKHQEIKLSELIEILDKHSYKDNNDLINILLEKKIISKESIMKYIDIQLKNKKVVDESLRELGVKTHDERWENILNMNTLGDFLIKKKKFKINSIRHILADINNSVPIEERLLKESLVTKEDISEALEEQIGKQRESMIQFC